MIISKIMEALGFNKFGERPLIQFNINDSLDWSGVTGTNKAEDNANKVSIFAQNDAPTTSYKAGDLWFDSNNGNTPYRANTQLQWVSVKDGSIAGAATTANWSGITDDDGNKPENNATDNSAQFLLGKLIADVANAKFDTSTKEILDGFTFGASGAIKMITDVNNGLWISPTGILGKKAGVTTFAVDTGGNASFRGDVVITGGSGISNLTDAGSLAGLDSVGASNCDSTIISGGKIITGLLTADNIQAGTLTGRTIQTSAVTYPEVILTSSGMTIHGQTLSFKDTSGNLYGYVYGSGSFNISASSGRNLVLAAGSYLYFNPTGNFVLPSNDNDLYLGGSTTTAGGSLGNDYTWKYVGAQIVDAKDLYKLNDITVIDQSGTTIYIKSGGGGLVIQDDTTTIATFSSSGGIDLAAGKEIDGQYAHLDCIVFANNSPLTEDGAIYYNPTDDHFYGRCNGSWRQLDN